MAAWIFAAPAWSATTEDLDKLLEGIAGDIAAKRLTSPANNNALDKIEEFRSVAPFDFRVVPLTYQWGEAYVEFARQALAKNDYVKAQEYLDKVWPVAALTPGLEDAQRSIDDARATGAAPAAIADADTVSRAEQERQRKLADAAEREKQRLKEDAEKQKRADAERKAEEARKAAAEKALREQQERERRAALAAANEAKAREAARPAPRPAPVRAAAVDDIDIDVLETVAPVVKAAKPAPVVKPAATPKPVIATTPVAQTTRLWAEAKEESKPLARYDIPADALAAKDRDIADKMGDVCERMVKEDASVVIHSADKSDYRWLAVRMTLCARRIDRSYRLRHSHEDLSGANAPFVTLHPPRDTSLVQGSAE